MEQTETDCPKPYGQDDSCDFNPEFAVICSFIAQFGSKIDIELNIEELKQGIEDQTNLNESLIDLHVKLLKKIRRYFVRDQWEKALIRYTLEYSYEDAYELETLGYLKTRPSIKLQLLRRLLDAQFECDQKFKSSVNLDEANQLRLAPTGRDIKGNTYWHQSDAEGNLRVFQEGPVDYKSWKTICKTSNELKQLLDNLEEIKDDKVKGEPMDEPYHPLPEIFPELFQTKVEETEPDKASEIETNKKTNGKGGKRGKGRGRWKKSVALDPVKEEEENSIDVSQRNHDSNRWQDLKPLPQESEQSQSSTIVSKSCSSPEDGSIESQVTRTMESLLDRVVSTFEFILKPLSRNFTSNNTEPAELPKTKPRKRPTKREKAPIEVLPRRSSSRIQQLQQKKEEEIKKSIDSRKSISLDQELSNSSSSGRNHRNNLKEDSESPERETKKGKRRKKDRQRWRPGKGKKKLSWDKDDSDLSSTSSLTESNEDEDDDDLDLSNEKLDYDNNNDDDDEFACEDEDTNNEPVIIKRARTARQIIEEPDETGELNTSSILEEDKPCGRCDKSNDPEWILLCDMCDDGYHTSCCLPPLMIVPDGDWFCPSCEHKTLLIKLKEFYASIVEIEEAKERERQKRLKSRKKTVKKDVVDEITIPNNEITEKRQRDFLSELNEPIAMQQLDEELLEDELPINYRERASKPKKQNRKRRSYEDDDDDDEIVYGRRRPKKGGRRRRRSESEESGDEPSSDQYSVSSVSSEDRPKVRKARACVSYQFKEYDELIKSAIQDDTDPVAPVANEYDDDDVDEEQEPETPEGGNFGRGKDMATIEALAYQQENGLVIQTDAEAAPVDGQSGAVEEPKSGGRGRNRKKGRRLNDLDADSEIDSATSDESFQASSATEEEEEDDDEDDETEVDSDDDSSLDEILTSKYRKSRSKKNNGRKRRRRRSESYESEDDYEPRSRRRASNRVSYKESSEDDDEDFLVERKKRKKAILSSDEESRASWKGSSKSEADDDDDDNDNNVVEKPQDDETTTSVNESFDEIIGDAAASQTSNTVSKELEPEIQPPLKAKSPENGDVPPGVKRVRLEKRETRPVYQADLMNESVDELTVPTTPAKLVPRVAPPKKPRTGRPKKQPGAAASSSAKAGPAQPVETTPVNAPAPSGAPTNSTPCISTPNPGVPLASTPTKAPSLPPQPCTPPSINRQPAPMMHHPSMLPRPTGPPPPGPHPYPPPPHRYHLSPIPHQPYMPHHMYPPPPSPYSLPHGYPHPHQPPPPPHQTHMSPLPPPHHSPYPPPPSPYHPYNTYMGPNGPYMSPQPVLRAAPPPPAPPHQMMRSSISDLNQYCNGPAYPTGLFSSFNVSLPPKNQSPPHPPFYEEDDVRSKPTSTKGKQKTSQKTA